MRKIIMITGLLFVIGAYAYMSGPSTPEEKPTTPQIVDFTEPIDPNTVPETENIPDKDYTKWLIPSQTLAANLTDLPEEMSNDCLALYNGQNDGGDLLATLIVDPTIKGKSKLVTYTPDYLKKLEYKIVQRTNQQYQSDFYAFKTCNIGPKLDVVAGYLWPKGKSTTQTDGKFAGEVEFGFQEDGALIIVDNNKVMIYDNVDLMNNSATGAETLPCKTKLEGNGDKVRWSCFKGFKIENGEVVGDLMKEYLFALDGSTPKIWEGAKNLITPEKPEETPENKEEAPTLEPEATTIESAPDPAQSTSDAIAQRTDQIKFQSCGNLTLYSNQPWYSDLKSSAGRTKLNLEEINQGCHSDNGKILVMISPNHFVQFGDIYRFDIITQKLERAHIDTKNQPYLAAPIKFGKREGNVIKLQGQANKDGCSYNMSYDYDFINNVIELKQSQKKCEGDTEAQVETF